MIYILWSDQCRLYAYLEIMGIQFFEERFVPSRAVTSEKHLGWSDAEFEKLVDKFR